GRRSAARRLRCKRTFGVQLLGNPRIAGAVNTEREDTTDNSSLRLVDAPFRMTVHLDVVVAETGSTRDMTSLGLAQHGFMCPLGNLSAVFGIHLGTHQADHVVTESAV